MLIVSDIHFGARPGSGLGQTAARLTDAIIAAALAAPDRQVLIPGDFTMGGHEDEYRAAEHLVVGLLDAGCIVACTPGNHDFGRFQGERFGLGSDRRRERFRHFVLRHVLRQPTVVASKDFDVIHRVGHDVIVALRSTHRHLTRPNRIRGKQLAWATRKLDDLRLTRRDRVHLLTHRSLWSDDGDRHPAMEESKRLEDTLLGPYGVRSFIHGHNHGGVTGRRATPERGLDIFKLAAPSLADERVQANEFVGALAWDPAAPAAWQRVQITPTTRGRRT